MHKCFACTWFSVMKDRKKVLLLFFRQIMLTNNMSAVCLPYWMPIKWVTVWVQKKCFDFYSFFKRKLIRPKGTQNLFNSNFASSNFCCKKYVIWLSQTKNRKHLYWVVKMGNRETYMYVLYDRRNISCSFEIYGPPLLTLQEKKALCRFDPPTEDLLLWMLAACLHTPLLPPKPNFLFYDIQRKKVVLFTVLSTR